MRKRGRILLALLGALCIFSGCGKSTEKIQPEQNAQQQSKEEDLEKEGEGQEKEVYVQPEMKGEITVSSFFEQEFLSTAAEQFMELYPDVTVTINVYDEKSGTGSVEDYQTYLNTKIMSGKADDIIFNSFLPVEKYSEMGVFEDLSRYISLTPEMSNENYFMNVLESAKKGSGEIYLLPYMAKFDVIGFSEELLQEQPELVSSLQDKSFSERMDIAKELFLNTEKRNVYLIQSKALSYMDWLIEDSFNDFIDIEKKEAAINSESYINLLNEVKELSESNGFGSDKIDFYNTEYYFAAMCDYDVQAAFYELDTQENISYSMPITNKAGDVAINANACLALNSASDKKDLAWEFMKFLLSEEVQTLPSVHGLAVHRRGFETAVERYYNYYTGSGSSIVDKTEYGELLESWMEQVNTCDMVDAALWSLIEEENSKFFEGKQSAEETASILQRKIEQYMNE